MGQKEFRKAHLRYWLDHKFGMPAPQVDLPPEVRRVLRTFRGHGDMELEGHVSIGEASQAPAITHRIKWRENCIEKLAKAGMKRKHTATPTTLVPNQRRLTSFFPSCNPGSDPDPNPDHVKSDPDPDCVCRMCVGCV